MTFIDDNMELIEDLVVHVLADFHAEAQGGTPISHYQGRVHELFAVYTWFATPEQLLERLLQTRNDGDDVKGRDKAVKAMVRYWKVERPTDWCDPQLLFLWENYLTAHYDNPTLEISMGTTRQTHCASLISGVVGLSVKELAEQLTAMVHEKLRSIALKEIRGQGWLYKEQAAESPNVLHFLRFHNNVSLWAGATVLSRTSPLERAAVIGYLLSLAEALSLVGNYDTMFAVYEALASNAIRRLRKTWNMVGPDTQKLMHYLEVMCAPINNYAQYRLTIKQLPKQALCLPYMLLLLKDVVRSGICSSDGTVNTQMPNKTIYETAVSLLLRFSEQQELRQPYESKHQLVTLLRVVLETPTTWDKLYTRSLGCEGASLDLLPTSTRSPDDIHDDFQQPTLERSGHEGVALAREIERLVANIFALYDSDNDNMLEEVEFRHVLHSFPFLGDFLQVDTDGDGMIDRDELRRALRKMANAPELALTDPGMQTYHQPMEVTVSITGDNSRYYNISFLLPNGNTHTIITRYSALLKFHRMVVDTGLVEMGYPFKFPPKQFFPWNYPEVARKRREIFETYFTDLC
eukprot:Ihof_evm4s381 gene=Ihof_evmTU4s381